MSSHWLLLSVYYWPKTITVGIYQSAFIIINTSMLKWQHGMVIVSLRITDYLWLFCSKRKKNEKKAQSQVVLSPSLWRFVIVKSYLTVYIVNVYWRRRWNQNISSIAVLHCCINKCIVSLSKLFDDQYAIYNAYLQLTGKVRTLLAWSSVVMFGIYLHNNGITSNFRNF